jgi:hypothetical protein
MPAVVEFKFTEGVVQVIVPLVLAVVVGAVVFCVTDVVVEYEQPLIGLTTVNEYVPGPPEAVVD